MILKYGGGRVGGDSSDSTDEERADYDAVDDRGDLAGCFLVVLALTVGLFVV